MVSSNPTIGQGMSWSHDEALVTSALSILDWDCDGNTNFKSEAVNSEHLRKAIEELEELREYLHEKCLEAHGFKKV